ncbi:lysM and putative peptidoglycan-binding domain-containing protein 3 [Caerostris extrusa]|uniref:LysM and putative peptidoglycan-binding domain-containing protein 3 n=1 Tax=Caerostris extrusa TaxID=172846 RepID=A0AAV4X7X1_CAEEX|nr:lysM and putative peptidoglycan-binding domain-containing protein 3 [Caerostris extrusa]
MNSVVVEKFDFNSKRRLNTPLQNVRRFVSNKRKSRKSMYEKIPLTSPDTDSCSDEDITLHDIRHLRNDLNDTCENSLRKIKKLDQKRNGAVTENDKTSDPVSDLKRANNLISSQEFFGLKHLKIPVKKHSLLTEILKDTPETKSNSIIIEENCENIQTINIGIGSAGRCPSPQDSTAFFKRMDEDLVKIMLSTNTQKESLEAAAAALTTPQIQPLVKDPYNTVDWGIQWNYLILCIIIVAVIIPTAVALYMYTRNSHESEHHVYHNCSSSTESYSSAPELITDKS